MQAIKRLRGKRLLFGAAVLVSLVAGAGALHAGFREGAWEVRFSGTATQGSFEGYMASARASADDQQYIGCEVEWGGPTPNNLPTVSPYSNGWCYARDKNGNTRRCHVTIKYNTATALLGNITQDSYIQASYFTVDGIPYCSNVRIYNYSYDPVKK